MNSWLDYFVIIIDIVSALVILYGLISHSRFQVMPSYHRLGLAFAVIGLLGQVYRSYLSVSTGLSPRDSEIPWWVFKDVGYFILSVSYIEHYVRKALDIKRRANEQSN